MVLKTIKTVDSDYFKSVSSHDSSRSEAGERAGIRGVGWGWGTLRNAGWGCAARFLKPLSLILMLYSKELYSHFDLIR